MIKAQTAMTGGEKGGREEGREEERFLERQGRQDMQKEKEEEKEEGKHRGGLFQAEVVSLQGLCTRLCQKEGDKTLAGHFLMYSTLKRSTSCIENNANSQTSGTDKHKPTCGHIHSYNTCKSRKAITCTSSVLLAGGDLDSGNEIQFLCCNFYGDKTLEDSTVCPVCNRISLFLLFLLLSFFFFWQACFVDCFSSACCPFHLCLLPFFLPLFLHLPLSPLAQSGLSGL